MNPDHVHAVPAGSACVPVKSTAESFEKADAGIASPARSIPGAYRIVLLAPARRANALSALVVWNGATRALPPPPTNGVRAVGPITTMEDRLSGASGSAPLSFLRSTAP